MPGRGIERRGLVIGDADVEPEVNMWIVAQFSLITVMAVSAAWEPKNYRFRKVVAWMHLKDLWAYILMWIVTIVVFCWLFRANSERWEFLCLVVEMAGVVYLAREVHYGQEFESIKNKLERFPELDEITDLEEWYIRYLEIDNGVSRADAMREIRDSKLRGKWNEEVAALKADVPRAIGRFKAETTDLVSKYRRWRLLLGLSLVILSLWGHGLLASTPREHNMKGSEPLAGMDSGLKDSISRLQQDQAQQSGLIGQLQQEIAAQRREIDAIKQENKRWHVVRPRPKRCPAFDSQQKCCCANPSSSSVQEKK